MSTFLSRLDSDNLGAMVRLTAIIGLACLTCALAVFLHPDRWETAEQVSAKDADKLAELIGTPDKISWHLTSNAALLRAMLWDSDGTRLYPPMSGMTPVPYKFSDEVERRVTAFQIDTEGVRWTNFDISGDQLLTCRASPAVCLIYDRALLEEALSLRQGALSEDASEGILAALLALGSLLFGGAAFWLRHRSVAAAPDFRIVPERHMAIRDTLEVTLTPRDLKLLTVLEERDGAVVTKDELYDAGWGRDYMPNSRSLDQHIINLRKKLDPDKSRAVLIETVHGVGYRLVN